VTLKSGLVATEGHLNQHKLILYDFLLTFHSYHEPISYRFRHNRRFQLKVTNFFNPVYLTPPQKGFPLEFGTDASGQKRLEWLGYQMVKKVLW